MQLTKKREGFTIIEIVISLTLLTMLAFLLMRENVTAVKQRMWSIRFIMAQSALNQHQSLAKVIDKDSLGYTSTVADNPWHARFDQAEIKPISIGKIAKFGNLTPSASAEGVPVKAFLMLSHSVDQEYVHLHQSVIFRSGGFYYRLSSVVTR